MFGSISTGQSMFHKIAYSNPWFTQDVDWLQSLKQFFINVLYFIPVASLTVMALF